MQIEKGKGQPKTIYYPLLPQTFGRRLLKWIMFSKGDYNDCDERKQFNASESTEQTDEESFYTNHHQINNNSQIEKW